MNVPLNFIAFQVGWFACVLGAANAMPWLGLAVCLMVLLIHLMTAEYPSGEFRLILSAVSIGMVLDSLLVSVGFLAYPNGILVAGMAPYWILAMWALFATTLNVSMRWMHDRFVLAALFGAVGGPLSYLAGARLGGVIFVDLWPAVLSLTIGWGLAMPGLVRLAQYFDGMSGKQQDFRLEPGDA